MYFNFALHSENWVVSSLWKYLWILGLNDVSEILKCIFLVFFFLNIYLFLSDWWLLYNSGLIPVIHQCELTISVHMSPLSWISLPPPTHSHRSGLLQSPSLSFLSHTANSHWLSIYTCLCICFHGTLSIHLTLWSIGFNSKPSLILEM